MSDITGKEVEKLLKKAWVDLFDYYDGEVRRYSKDMTNDEAIKEHWVLWTEHDLMFQLGRFFYKQLPGNTYQNIVLHFDKFLSYSTFKAPALKKKLEHLKKKLKRARAPKSDLIIVNENNLGHFLLCAEAKFFHYSVGRYNRTPQEVIKKDIDTLVAVKELEIAERVVFMLFDDYYFYFEPKKHESIESELGKAEEHKLTVLYHQWKRLNGEND